MFTNAEIAAYYDRTRHHYERWWGLKRHRALHYGIWDDHTRTFGEALANTNRLLMEAAGISTGDHVLDAGCGVGGAALDIAAAMPNTKVTGISLSNDQVNAARQAASEHEVSHRLRFEVRDYAETGFPANAFDVVWACESLCHASDRAAFASEVARILRPGGRLVVADYFIPEPSPADPQDRLKRWLNVWEVPGPIRRTAFTNALADRGFDQVTTRDYTAGIRKTSLRMYRASLLGQWPARFYNFTHPSVSRFARNHYQCGIHQYHALKQGLWEYRILSAEKASF